MPWGGGDKIPKMIRVSPLNFRSIIISVEKWSDQDLFLFSGSWSGGSGGAIMDWVILNFSFALCISKIREKIIKVLTMLTVTCTIVACAQCIIMAHCIYLPVRHGEGDDGLLFGLLR